jgi:ACS family tartrate transporter-like MFS transporter
LLAFTVLAYMTERPAAATWLDREQKTWLETALDSERQEVKRAHHGFTLRHGLTDPRALALSIIWFANLSATYSITFFLPQIVKSLGLSNLATGLVTAIPYIIGAVGMLVLGRSSDRRNERRRHYAVACTIGAIGLVGAGALSGSFWALAAMSLAAVGLYGSKPAFWPLPSMFLIGTAAASGIALVNSIGNLGRFVGPYAVGWIKESTGSFEAGLYLLAACALVSATVTVIAVRPARRLVS